MCKAQLQGVDMLHYGVRMMYRHAHDCLLHSIDDDKNKSCGNTNIRCRTYLVYRHIMKINARISCTRHL